MMMMMMNCQQRTLSYERGEKIERKVYEEARLILNQKKHFGPKISAFTLKLRSLRSGDVNCLCGDPPDVCTVKRHHSCSISTSLDVSLPCLEQDSAASLRVSIGQNTFEHGSTFASDMPPNFEPFPEITRTLSVFFPGLPVIRP
jgi:hypothetical protein